MNSVLARWNELSTEEAMEEILPCCGCKAWAQGMAVRRPVLDEAGLLGASDEVWRSLLESDWLEAFASHPRIGESYEATSLPARSARWSGEEQRNVSTVGEEIKMALAKANREYEQRFRRIFIVCATGKSPSELLKILQRRLHSDEVTEFHEAAEQQRQIARIRLKKWLQE